MKKISLFLVLALMSIIVVSCPGVAHPYIVFGNIKVIIADKNGTPFKKGDSGRFEVYEVGDLYESDNKILQPTDDSDLTYVFVASESGKQVPSIGKLDEAEKNELFNRLIEDHGFVVVDLKNEYKPYKIKLKEAKYKEVNKNRRGAYGFEFEYILSLGK